MLFAGGSSERRGTPRRGRTDGQERTMVSWGRYAGQGALYALFAPAIGYCSTSPQYRPLEQGQALLRLSFKHAGKLVAECRKRSPEELARLPANMRAELDCPRERRSEE